MAKKTMFVLSILPAERELIEHRKIKYREGKMTLVRVKMVYEATNMREMHIRI